MRGELFFKIPNDLEVMAKLVEAIPSHWSWVDGQLRAPKCLIDVGEVEESTGFAVMRFHSIRPTIIGRYDEDKRRNKDPNLFAIMLEQKLPGFIMFDEAGYETPEITLELVKRIAAGFLRKGYRGGLHFYSGCYDNSKYNNPAKCSMIFEVWNGGSFSKSGETGMQPARVKIGWESKYCGKEEHIASIVSVCRSLNLCEYIPVPSLTREIR